MDARIRSIYLKTRQIINQNDSLLNKFFLIKFCSSDALIAGHLSPVRLLIAAGSPDLLELNLKITECGDATPKKMIPK
jgi:hypothetical protein